MIQTTQTLVAEKIFNYYLQIIEINKCKGINTFPIDTIFSSNEEMDLVKIEDKYDGKSLWREALNISEEDNWSTIAVPSFREAFIDNDSYRVNILEILKIVSTMLSKKGIANYFDVPNENFSFDKYFYLNDESWLYIVNG